MRQVHLVSIALVMLTASPVWAQKENSSAPAVPCVVAPIFHCVQPMEKGSAIAHFGYELKCSEDAGPEAELFIDIGADNRFSPDRLDRGQPKVFLPGKHSDEFEVEFSLAEVKGDASIQWSVLDETVVVDFSKTKDGSLDCSVLP